jgi:hypothetical protein
MCFVIPSRFAAREERDILKKATARSTGGYNKFYQVYRQACKSSRFFVGADLTVKQLYLNQLANTLCPRCLKSKFSVIGETSISIQ